MAKAITTRYDVAEHLRTPDEMALTLKPALRMQMTMLLSLQKLSAILPGPRVCHKWRVMLGFPAKAFTRHFVGNEASVSTLF